MKSQIDIHKPIFLSGPMGSGKSSVAKVLACALGVDLIDLDARIAERVGMSVQDFFDREGEAAFRKHEHDLVSELVNSMQRGVVALGGGTVTSQALRRKLIDAGYVVSLRASAAALSKRASSEGGRPLLSGKDAFAVLSSLLKEREGAYAECHLRVDTDNLSVEQVCEVILSGLGPKIVPVLLSERSYQVRIGFGLRRELNAHRDLLNASSVIGVSDSNVAALWAEPVFKSISGTVKSTRLVTLLAGEVYKTIDSVQQIWDAALEGSIDREALMLGIGGGVVGDLAGFAASTLLRGIRFGQLPTTLLSMVDSAVGGKTGFDRKQGKNLIGSFYQPSFVLCDIESLSTLPDEEYRSGLAEVVKSAWLDSEASVAALESDSQALNGKDPSAIERAVYMSVALKARIVSEDEHESGARKLLNLGHTLGHAIEARQGFAGYRHGEAVALGMVAAMRLSARLNKGSVQDEKRLVALLSSLGLPTAVDPWLDEKTFAFIKSDKKMAHGKIHFVLPGVPGQTEICELELEQVQRKLSP
ncbi:MAG: 3-dehydroquinate synthase [Myxococcales bacterium]|nr:MAG: 3-dehydroquinate synthase [Myxococcales bacterium]